MLLRSPAVQSSYCDCLTVEGDNVLGHMPGVLAGAQAGRKQSSDIIKSSGSAVVSLQNTHSPLGWGQGCSVISGSGPNNPVLVSTWDQLSSLFWISSVQAINKIHLRRQVIQYMIIFPDPIPTPCFVLWEMVLSLQCRRAIELVSIVQMFLRFNLLCRAQSWTSNSVQLNKWSLGEQHCRFNRGTSAVLDWEGHSFTHLFLTLFPADRDLFSIRPQDLRHHSSAGGTEGEAAAHWTAAGRAGPGEGRGCQSHQPHLWGGEGDCNHEGPARAGRRWYGFLSLALNYLNIWYPLKVSDHHITSMWNLGSEFLPFMRFFVHSPSFPCSVFALSQEQEKGCAR